ncbi:MAG: hypothetical protein AB7Q42_06025 [Acidimicrobiia bacterium]
MLDVPVYGRDNPDDHSLAGSLRREIVAATMFHTLQTCPHVLLPQVVQALVVKPTKLMCAPCIVAATKLHAAKHPDTCDVCGHETETFREFMLQIGIVILSGHVCDDCYRREVDT